MTRRRGLLVCFVLAVSSSTVARASEGGRRYSGTTAVAEPSLAVPPPRLPADVEVLRIAIGLAPEALGNAQERSALDALERGVTSSTHPPVEVRRLRPGSGTPKQNCRAGRDDLAVMIGYLAQRPEPVVLAHDCRLDMALGVRSSEAASEPGLVAALWREHDAMVRDGVKERRRPRWGRRVRIGVAAGVALAAIGVAIGVILANVLREEVVVLTVGP